MIKVNCVTAKGGAVELNEKDHVWASYAVATCADLEPAELFYAGARLMDGRSVQFFLNRETGLVVVDVIDRKGNGGVELLRQTLKNVEKPAGKRMTLTVPQILATK